MIFKDNRNLINVLLLYSIQPTEIRLQVLRAIQVLCEKEFTGADLLAELHKEYPLFQNHTLFFALMAFYRKGLIERRSKRKNKRGRPNLVFAVPLTVVKLLGR